MVITQGSNMASFLKQFHRTGGTVAKLPSNGFYQPANNVEFNSVDMVEVYPRSAADEMLLTNPDFLVTGQTTERILSSCVPRVANVSALPLNDANVLLMAIQKASKGAEYKVETSCPKCEVEQEFVYDLDYLLSSVMELPDEWKVVLDKDQDFNVYLKPWTIADFNKHFYNFFLSMQQASTMDREMAAGNLSEEQIKSEKIRIGNSYSTIAIESLLYGIVKITCGEDEEYDKKEILDFLNNCPAAYVQVIDAELSKIHNIWIPDQNHVCNSCSHTWLSKPEFNPSTFFGRRSPI
jgi:hypothetical protein